MGTASLHFAPNWLGKKNMYEISELKGLYVKDSPVTWDLG